jgi:hypothetical protein
MLGFGTPSFGDGFRRMRRRFFIVERNQEKVFDKLAAELGRAAEELGLRERVPARPSNAGRCLGAI